MSDDFAWLTDHSVEIFQQYAGKWIAVLDQKVIAVAETATEAARLAEELHPGSRYILEAVEAEPERI